MNDIIFSMLKSDEDDSFSRESDRSSERIVISST